MGALTTHVLDLARGRPAEGLRIDLTTPSGLSSTVTTNGDGRVDTPLAEGASFETGTYRLQFHAGHYLASHGLVTEETRFLDVIPIHFQVTDTTAHYHVPLLLSPYGYSTYRGS